MTEPRSPQPPDALLFLTSACPFCPAVLQALGELVKAGRIGRLEAVNIQVRPEMAEAYQVRTVPWVRLGPFELDGLRSQAELAQWAQRAGTAEGRVEYLRERLAGGQLQQVTQWVLQDPARIEALLPLVAAAETAFQVRLGASAIMEALQGSATLKRLVDGLGALTASPDARVRADACHFLALTQSDKAVHYLRRLLDDPAEDVRELAAEGLMALQRYVEGD